MDGMGREGIYKFFHDDWGTGYRGQLPPPLPPAGAAHAVT